MRVHTIRAPLLVAALVSGFFAVAAPALGGVINEDLKLSPDDGAERDLFGLSIAIDNGVVAVGAIYDDDNGSDSGSAYLFDASTGAQIAKLLPNDGVAEHWFGHSIAIDNGVVAVGAPLDGDNGLYSGSAYLFDASTGAQIAKLLPSDGGPGAQFGNSIAIDNGVVAVGAWHAHNKHDFSGSAYLFDASNGAQLFKLLPSDGAYYDWFGSSVAIRDGVVAVGAPLDDNGNRFNSGSAYLFDVSTGSQIAKLLARDGVRGDQFGWSIAIDNGVAAAGAPADSDIGTGLGSAYLFDASTGEQMAKLLPSDGVQGDLFGRSIAISNGGVVVGAPRGDDDNNCTDSGSAYLFDAPTGQQLVQLLPSDGEDDDWFGGSVAIENAVLAVGAYLNDGSGSAYLFEASPGEACARVPEWICDGDVDGDGQVNPVDSGLVQAAFGSCYEQELCNYDVDCDGQINPVDSGIVQSLFGTCEAPRETCP